MIFEWLFTFLVVYLLYKLIFDFILPVARVSSQMRNKVDQMQQQQQTKRQRSETANQPKNAGTPVRPSAEDYIDFEEIK